MKISNKLKKAIKRNVLSISTATKKGKPHTIYVACVKVLGNKIIITDNFMKETVSNLKKNNFVSIAVLVKGAGYELQGVVKYFASGKYFDFAKALPSNKGFPCKGVVVVSVSKIKKMK